MVVDLGHLVDRVRNLARGAEGKGTGAPFVAQVLGDVHRFVTTHDENSTTTNLLYSKKGEAMALVLTFGPVVPRNPPQQLAAAE